MIIHEEEELSERMLAWVIAHTSPGGVVRSFRRLYGGISSIVHSVTLQEGDRVTECVLRQFDNADWLRKEPDLARHEAHSLQWAALADVQTPQVIAWDETGSQSGTPALLMTKLEGEVVLKPGNMESWVKELARVLARIHQVSGDGFPWTYFSYRDRSSLELPGWTACPQVWQAALDIVKGPRPDFKPCLIHRDYHPTNVLWEGSRVSGVVDWVNACRGPAGADVGHCRVNLAQLFGVETADLFLSAYRAYAGEAFSYDPYWDLVSVMDMQDGTPGVYEGWIQLGVTELTDELIMERMDEYASSLVKRAAESG
ncbi:phosphotransferase family protein [Paenibacillus puerhi]|uniref:phosphotransferase family protein n=1 Tax=Paenibacillus puerhi TaxID=2692622 RepID=UPI001F299B61|nr:aminoglycoside phosphotransferase family protein [Paenibacillus puerhi]